MQDCSVRASSTAQWGRDAARIARGIWPLDRRRGHEMDAQGDTRAQLWEGTSHPHLSNVSRQPACAARPQFSQRQAGSPVPGRSRTDSACPGRSRGGSAHRGGRTVFHDDEAGPVHEPRFRVLRMMKAAAHAAAARRADHNRHRRAAAVTRSQCCRLVHNPIARA